MTTKTLFAAALAFAAPALIAAPALAQDAGGGRAQKAWQKFSDKFEAANTTHDGHLTLEQAQAGNMPIIARNFSAIDSDHKGYVTKEEVGQFVASKRRGG